MNVKQKLELIIGFIIILVIVSLWSTVIVNEFTKLPKDFSLHYEHEGTDQMLLSDNGTLSESFILHEMTSIKTKNVDGNTLEIETHIVGINGDENSILFDSKENYFVDAYTRQNVKNHQGYFLFPLHVKKQNYEFFHPMVIVPATFIFERESSVNNLLVYVFSYNSTENDISDTYPNLSDPHPMRFKTYGEMMIEPNTGNIVDYEVNWDIYYVENGIRKNQVELGHSELSDPDVFILSQYAINAKNILFAYEVLIPIIIVTFGTFILIIFAIIQHIKLHKQTILKTNELLLKKEKSDYDRIQREKHEKLEMIGAISAQIHHDIRNPLAIILNSLETLHMKLNSENKQITGPTFEKIYVSIFRITHQLESVLDYARTQNVVKKPISINELIKNSIESIHNPKKIKITLPKNDVIISVDQTKMESVFYNIIQNAVQAIGESGLIAINATEVDQSTIIEIEDSGPGIHKENIGKIFDPLFTTKQTGTGLGLASVKRIIQEHGGTISVKSPPTIFTITLPKISD